MAPAAAARQGAAEQGDPEHDGGECRGGQRVQVRLPRQPRVERLELAGRLQR
jgi:hypothetical protein